MANNRLYLECKNPECKHENKSACILRDTVGWWEPTRAKVELDEWLTDHNYCFPAWDITSEDGLVWEGHGDRT